MHRLSVFSLRNRALIALVTVVVAVFGGISLTLLRQELIPSISYPQLFIVSAYPGASPEVVEHDVSTPIEDAIQSIPGLTDTSATSSANVSSITASFDYDTSLATAEQKVTSAINRIASQLPDGVDPTVIQFSLSDFPILQLAVSSDLDPVELSARLERIALPELTRLDGVASVSLTGAATQEVDITPDAAALAAHGLTTQSITDLLDANGVLLPAGNITEDGETLTVQAGAEISDVDALRELPFPATAATLTPDAAPVTLADVASVEVVDAAATGYARVNGEDALSLSITKTSTGNTVAVSNAVKDALPAIAASLGSGTTFTAVFDQAPFIEQSIASLTQEGLLGLVFAVLVILVFLLSVRSTLVTAVSIPTSVLIAFIGMWAFGYTLNVITLGGLTIAIGRVVDDSIVVIENIKRHLEAGEEKRQAILTAVREVAGAITASTITTVAVFLPIGLVGDEVGELFRPFAVTIALALFASLFVALTIVPVLAYWFLGRGRARRRRGAAPAETAGALAVDEHPDAMQRGYLPVIRWTLRFPWIVLLLAVLTLGGSLALTPLMGLNFVGDSGQNTLTVTQTLSPAASLATKNEEAERVEAALMGVDGVETVHASVGSGSGSSLSAVMSAFGGSGTTFSIVTDPDADQAALQEAVQDALDALPDAGELSISGEQGFGSSTVDVTVRAATADALSEGVAAVSDAVRDLPSAAAVEDNISASTPYIAVVVDRAEAAARGLTELQVGALVMAAMNPSAVGEVTFDERTMSVYVRQDAAPTTIEELRAFTVPTLVGMVPLEELASVEEALGPASITTEQGVRTAVVSITPATDDVGSTTFAVQEAIDALELPSGVTVELGGVATQMLDAFEQLGLALLAAILIVYVVMVATFRSLRQPLLLLVSVPFAATGAIVLQVLSGIPLGVSSLIGMLMLVGIVVTNAIVLVDLVNQYRERGYDVRSAVEHGAARRLRPIVMTAAATIFALVPLAIGITGHGGFISQPLAIIVIGGLVSSTLLTLIVLPVVYYLVEGRAERRAAKRTGRPDPAGSAPAAAATAPVPAGGAAAAPTPSVLPDAGGAPPVLRRRRRAEADGAGPVEAPGAD